MGTKKLFAVRLLQIFLFLRHGEGDEEESRHSNAKEWHHVSFGREDWPGQKIGCSVVENLIQLATAEVKTAGKFTIPGLCMLKTKVRPARKAGTSMAFGKQIKVKARPVTKIVKAYCVKALKDSI